MNTEWVIGVIGQHCDNLTYLEDVYEIGAKDVLIIPFSVDTTGTYVWIGNEYIEEGVSKSFTGVNGYVVVNGLQVDSEGNLIEDDNITHIRQNITSEQQLVLLSAVLPNSGDIAQWLFEDRGCLATDDRIVSTPKSIGFSSTQRDIHFFSDDKSNEDYYIPRILRVEQLKKLPRERSNKYFPDLSSSIDVAIYNAIKLCHRFVFSNRGMDCSE